MISITNQEKSYYITTTRGELSILELEVLFNDAAYDKKIPNKEYVFDDFEFLRIDGRPRNDTYYNVYAIYNIKTNKLSRIIYEEIED